MHRFSRKNFVLFLYVATALGMLVIFQGQACAPTPTADNGEVTDTDTTGDSSTNDSGTGGDHACLEDAAGLLKMLWIGSDITTGNPMGTPTAVFEYTSLPWYFATQPTDYVFAFVGSETEHVDDEGEGGPYMDAGTPLLVQGAPEGNIELDRQVDNLYLVNMFTLMPRTFSWGGTFSWNVPGGNDVNGFTKEMPIPEELIVSAPTPGEVTLDRSSPLQITWNAPQGRQDAHIIVMIIAVSGDLYGVIEADLIDDGSATIGAEYLSQLPSDNAMIVVLRSFYGSVALTKPAGKKAYFASTSIASWVQ